MHSHQLQRRLTHLEPLSGLHRKVCQALAVEPGAVGAPRVPDADLAALEDDLGMAPGGLRIVENDVARLSTNGGGRSADVACLGRTIDVLDLENVVATHSFLRGVGASFATWNDRRKDEPRWRAQGDAYQGTRKTPLCCSETGQPSEHIPVAHYPQAVVTQPRQAPSEGRRAWPERSYRPRQGAPAATGGPKRVPGPSVRRRN